MKKHLLLCLIVLFCSAASWAAISGPSSVCIGSTIFLSGDSTLTAGTWSSSNTSVATVTPAPSSGWHGVVTGVSAGTATIIYINSAGTSTMVVTVSPLPSPIVGGGVSFCAGTPLTLTSTPGGGTWSSGSSYIASVGASTGIVSGYHPGAATIFYTVAGCATSTTVTVNGGIHDSAITGPTSVCITGTTTMILSSGVPTGGTWSSSNTAVATVSGGVVTGVASGGATITYHIPGSGCASYGVRNIVVSGTTPTPSISGPSTVAVSHSITLSSSASGTWTSSMPSIATVSSSGVVSGVAAGTATISLTVSGCGGPASATKLVTVNADCIAGDVIYSGAPATSTATKVWLIKYNPSTMMLYAVDSQIVSTSGTMAHYCFCGMGTDSFRIKAAFMDTISSATTGYQPTYHTSSAYWSSASVVYHTSGVMDLGKDINMGWGTVTSGPGFIAGNVTTGANKGTADGDPVPGMLVFCVNNTTGAIMQQTYTNAAGHYSFSNLPTGVPFKIYPEAINYATTAYPAITLTSSSSSMSVANFVQHTLSHTITPIVVSVSEVAGANAGVNIYPNPATNVLNIEWNMQQGAGNATVSIMDVTGRKVLGAVVDMSATGGVAPINVTGLTPGMYLLQVKGNGLSVTSKVEIK